MNATHAAQLGTRTHRDAHAHFEHLSAMVNTVRRAVACGTCGRNRAAGADIKLLPPKDLTGGLRLSEVVRDGWSAARFTSLLAATLASPAGVRCRRCLRREAGPDHP